jgi:hypothetical protein
MKLKRYNSRFESREGRNQGGGAGPLYFWAISAELMTDKGLTTSYSAGNQKDLEEVTFFPDDSPSPPVSNNLPTSQKFVQYG